ncbi:glycosyltransferase family 2 protein [Vibrio zhugei]|uniref:Glycosyltransferase family 2 protein n=1 Tax=Vibrio zhugei TaxID=2479546 RepID=A0ABV7CCB6_9VIBR|nr:glycosyltransferase family 2 protein [Vibrio zhugei]
MASLVSIITPTHNSEKFIEETIRSVLEQTYIYWELIIIDDCSHDSSFDIIKRYSDLDERIKVFQLDKNSGAAVARNLGIEKANGRFISFLDSDDLWAKDKLASQVEFMLKNNKDFSFSAYYLIDEQGKEIGLVNVPKYVKYRDILKTCSIGCLTVMYDTKKLGKVYMPLIRKRQDFGLWLKILKDINYAYDFGKVKSYYRVRADSISANKKSAAYYQWKIYRNVENMGMISSLFYFFNYAFFGILKSKLPKVYDFYLKFK